jgi:hypothetical protein
MPQLRVGNMDKETLAALITTCGGVAILALLITGVLFAPGLIVVSCILLLLALLRFTHRPLLSIQNLTNSTTQSVAANLHSNDSPPSPDSTPRSFVYRGVKYHPPSQSQVPDAALLVEHSGKYRGNPWKSYSVQEADSPHYH